MWTVRFLWTHRSFPISPSDRLPCSPVVGWWGSVLQASISFGSTCKAESFSEGRTGKPPGSTLSLWVRRPRAAGGGRRGCGFGPGTQQQGGTGSRSARGLRSYRTRTSLLGQVFTTCEVRATGLSSIRALQEVSQGWGTFFILRERGKRFWKTPASCPGHGYSTLGWWLPVPIAMWPQRGLRSHNAGCVVLHGLDRRSRVPHRVRRPIPPLTPMWRAAREGRDGSPG